MKRRTIAFIGETSFDSYQSEMVTGALKAAKESGSNLIRFTIESAIYTNRFTSPVELIIGMIRKARPDGFMFLGWMDDIMKNAGRLSDLLGDAGRMPMLSIGKSLKGIPSIVMDGAAHVRELLEHLHGSHGCRNIVFVKPINPDERYKAYESFRKEHGLFKPELVVSNEDVDTEVDWFFTKRVKRIARLLLDKRKIKFDAIMSMYSYEAVYILEELKKRGYRVPEDIALTSWEDVDRGRYSNPSLTSVYYPFYEQAYKGFHVLLGMIEGKKTPPLIVVPGRVSIRRSCGCVSGRLGQVVTAAPESARALPRGIDASKLMRAFRADGRRLESLSESRVFKGLLSDILGKTDSAFLKTLEGRILSRDTTVDTLYRIQSDFLTVRAFLLPYIAKDPRLLARAESIWLKSQIVIEENIEAVAGFGEVMKRVNIHEQQEIAQNIVTTDNLAKLLDTFATSLSRINVLACRIFLFEGDRDPMSRQRLVFSFKNGKTADVKDGVRAGLTRRTFISEARRTVSLVYFLHIRQQLLGCVVFEPGPTDERVYSSLAIELSSALHGARTLESLKKANTRLQSAQKTVVRKSHALEESNVKLSQLDRLKNNFIANITHDFRSPLTIILNTVDLGLRYDTAGDFEKIVGRYNTIYDASAELKVSVDRLLDLAKMDAKGVRLQIRKLDVRPYLEGIADFYQSAVTGTKIQILCSLPPRPIGNFYTDVDKLEEILHNLVSNALKFVDPEGGVITIALHDDGSDLGIVVGDNGAGIPPNKLESIFERYERIEDVRGSGTKGTGIGLAFVKELMGYLRGAVRAESDGPGKGSRFILRFPKGREAFKDEDLVEDPFDLSEIHADQRKHFQRALGATLVDSIQSDEIEVSCADLNKEGEFDPQKGVILIVDDSYSIREILKEYLVNSGYRNFITATNGKAGIEAVFLHRPDIIICDYSMPKMRGDELHDQIASNPDFKRTPTLFLTAMTDKDLMLERKRKGAVAYLTKPIDDGELIVTIDIHMRRYMEYKLLVQQASTDELTGLANKQTIVKLLSDRVMLRTYRHLSVIFMDIDHFKSLNDMYGHPAGDAVLARIGKVIKESLRSYDKAGRFGGEEFLIVLPEATMDEAVIVAEKLRANVKNLSVDHGGRMLGVTSSFGVSSLIGNKESICSALGLDSLIDIYEVKDMKNAPWERIEETKIKIRDLLIDMADKALYRAKRARCGHCRWQSTAEAEPSDYTCPQCGQKDLVKGRDRVVAFEG
jgi:diguanylate cyclase (GGDEF)-like protein